MLSDLEFLWEASKDERESGVVCSIKEKLLLSLR